MKPYPQYKDSDIEWLKQIPAHWGRASIKHIVEIPVTDGPHETPNFPSEGIPFISAEAIKNRKIDFSKKRGFISPEDHAKYSRKYKPKKGDIYMVKSGASTGNVAVVETDEEFNIWSPLAVIRPDSQEAITEYVFYFMQSHNFFQAIESGWSFGTQQNIGMGVIENISLSVPPLDEQKAIADYLDRKTAVFDTLITQKQRLIQLLQEERTAIISHAVTQGLNPHAPRKPTGIPWLGDIPAHWEVKRVKYLAQILRGKFSHRPRNDPQMYNGPYPFIQTGDVAAASKYVTEYRQTLSNEGFQVSKEFPKGTLVMTIAANVGDVAILDFTACFPDSIVGFVPAKDVVLNYLFYLFISMRQQLLETAPINTQLNLNIDRVGNLMTILPPVSEQIAISELLDQKTAQIDQTIAQTEKQITLLQEYRTTLISHAVTGKIDVRRPLKRSR